MAGAAAARGRTSAASSPLQQEVVPEGTDGLEHGGPSSRGPAWADQGGEKGELRGNEQAQAATQGPAAAVDGAQ
jgi:hypothetical protein